MLNIENFDTRNPSGEFVQANHVVYGHFHSLIFVNNFFAVAVAL